MTITGPLADDVVVHRVGGADVSHLELNETDRRAVPPGLSVLADGTPAAASAAMRAAFPGRRWRELGTCVGSATVVAIRAAGFDVIEARTNRLPNHARIVHPDGEAGFTADNLARLSAAFVLTTGY